MKVGIVGAGPAGLAAAYQLAKAGVSVEVFEAGALPGGMAKSLKLWNQCVDLGPHRFFSKDARVNGLWLEVVGRDFKIVNRLTRILYQNKFYFYPLSPFNALKNLGPLTAFSCICDYVREKISPTPLDGSFETWVVHRFGRRLFDIFFKPYSEKLWGIPGTELSADFAAQRIKKLSLYEAILNSFTKDPSAKHKTLVENFAYPIQGTGMVYQRMADAIEKRGGKIHYNKPVQRVINERSQIKGLEFEDGESKSFDHIISTMPLSHLLLRLNDTPETVRNAASSLLFRNTILVYLNVNHEHLFSDQWIYVQSPELKTGRVTNFRNWVPEIYGNEKTSILALEYWCYDHDSIWTEADENLISLASQELGAIALQSAKELNKESAGLKPEILGGKVVRLPRCYPVYKKGYETQIKVIREYLNQCEGLHVIGRYGAFKYNNQDHSILMGILAAENLTQGATHDLWEINTDYEDYQEPSMMTNLDVVKK